MSDRAFAWGWRERSVPLPAKAAVVWGDAVGPFLARLEHMVRQASASGLTVCGSEDLIVLFGDENRLPWIDGVRYAAPSSDAPSLWLPNTEQPDVPHDLLARALLKRHQRQPLLLWRQPVGLVPLDRQVPLTERWLHTMSACLTGRTR